MRIKPSTSLLIAAFTLACTCPAHPGNSYPYGSDLTGHPVSSLATPGSRAVAVIFLASDCPICNRYIPEIQRLSQDFEKQGIAFWVVYPNPGETAAGLQSHRVSYSQNVPELLDPDHSLVRLAGVQTTPEAAVLVPGSSASGLHEIYRGRIDDRYVSFGHEKPAATHHDLEEALTAVIKGSPVPAPAGPAVGCAIVPLP